MPRKLTRPRRITYRCSERNYDHFYATRDKLEITTGELFDKLLEGNSNNIDNYKLISRIKQLTIERDKFSEINARLIAAQEEGV